MKEITTIITMELTVINKVEDEYADKIEDVVAEHKTPEFAREFEEAIGEELLNMFDDLKVVKIQDFVMDKAGGEDGRSEMDKNNN